MCSFSSFFFSECLYSFFYACTIALLHKENIVRILVFILLFHSVCLHKEKRKYTKNKASIDCAFFGFLWMETNLPVATK